MGVHYFSIVTNGTISSINHCFGNKWQIDTIQWNTKVVCAVTINSDTCSFLIGMIIRPKMWNDQNHERITFMCTILKHLYYVY